MIAAIAMKAWQLSLILRPFGFGAPGSLKTGEYNSLCEAEHASTSMKHPKNSVSDQGVVTPYSSE